MAVTTAQKRKQFDFRMLGLNLAAYLNWLLANWPAVSLTPMDSRSRKIWMDFALTAMFIGLFSLSKKDFFIDLAVVFGSILIVVAVGFFFPGSTGVKVATVIASAIGDGD
ncbi:hypothetical protein ACIQZD_19105 [Peribacillus sp. NPDC096447]|uniref:hypothetical protein n=1 Tax=Peribacillus sp. NPDC096447 TaxID=3364394 RepID=UPI00381BDE31